MKFLKVGLVIFGALAITALGIDAADTISGSRSTLLGQLVSTQVGACPEGMIEIQTGITFSCVDEYEAGPGDECPVKNLNSPQDTIQNIDNTSCVSVSKKDTKPWVYINREQAQLVCSRSNKRLPTAEEWYMFSLGTNDSDKKCNIDSNKVSVTGEWEGCVSSSGVFDAVGNVWEWVVGDVFDGTLNGRSLPNEGYVTQVDSSGIATETSGEAGTDFGLDYFWSEPVGTFAIMRGGFFGSREDAGIYSVHARTQPTFSGEAVGFRCVQ